VALTSVRDAGDERLADYRDLTDVALRTKIEPPHGLFIAEGEKVIRRAMLAGYAARSLLLSPEWLERMSALIHDIDAPVYVADPPVVEAVTGFHVHRGALAAFHRKALPAADEVATSAHRLAVLEDVVSHTNLGAIFRCAAALGMDGVVLSPSCADPLYRRSVRVSMGEVFAVPYARAPEWPGWLDRLRDDRWRIAALTPTGDATPLDQVDVNDDDRVAVLLGTEGPGLSDTAMARADLRVRIPMARGVDSLNVAAAAAITFWTLGRRHG
jgi:tRNA G18 (ribose-2'-O)-methylase SpoU